MTGRGHHLTGLAAGVLVAGLLRHHIPITWSAPIIAASWFGGVAPDRLEYLYRWRWVAHRTLTHWWPLWLALLIWSAVSPLSLVTALTMGLSVGALTHLLFDLPNPMGVPFIHPWSRVSLNLWRSGQREPLLVLGAFVIALSPWWGLH